MSISKKQIKTTLISLSGQNPNWGSFLVKESIENEAEIKKIEELDSAILSLEETKLLRQEIKNSSQLFRKISDFYNDKNNFLTNNTKYEQLFEDVRNLTIEKLAFFAVFYKQQLSNLEYFRGIFKQGDITFKTWFKTYVEFVLKVKLEKYFVETITVLSDMRKQTVLLTDIEKEKKKTVRYIIENMLESFKFFLEEVWNQTFKSLPEYESKRENIEKTIIF